MNSPNPSPVRDRSPLRFTWITDTKQVFRNSDNGITRALIAHRGLSGFEGIALMDWCSENIGEEDIEWGRTFRYGWWFRNEKWATQFLLMWQCSQPVITSSD